MSDGASLYMRADESMKAIIGGGEQPERMDSDDFEAMIRTAELREYHGYEEGEGYSGCSNACARIVLESYEKYPQLQNMTDTHEYLKLANGETSYNPFISVNTTLYDVLRKLYDDESDEYKFIFHEMSGFMWGWAVNAARSVLGLGPLPNPALLTISVMKE